MPDHVKLDIPFLYPLTYVPRGSRQARDVEVADVVSVEVPVATSTEVPLVISFMGGHWSSRRSFHGNLCRRYHDAELNGLAPGGRIADGDYRTAISILYPDRPTAAQATRRPVSRPDAEEVVNDGREAAVSELMDRARRLVFVDGSLWVPSGVPRLNLSYRSQNKWHAYNSDDAIQSAVSFTADRFDAFQSLLETFRRQGGIDIEGGGIWADLFDWDVAAETEVAANADYMAGIVVVSCGEAIHTLDASFIRRLAGLARSRLVLRDYPSPETAREVHATMTDLLPHFDKARYIWPRKHLINGIAAIEASRDYRDETLDEDDVAALSMGGGL